MFFKKKKSEYNVENVKELMGIISSFIATEEVSQIREYIVGPIDIYNYLEVKHVLLLNSPLTTFEIHTNDYAVIYFVSSKQKIDFVFASIFTSGYERKNGFFSLVEKDVLSGYLQNLNFSVLYEDGFVKIPGNEIVNKEYKPVGSISFL